MVALNNGEPPVPADDAINIDEDGFGSVDVLANDRDPDGGPLSILSVSVPGRGGSAIASGSTITYRPAPDMHGTDFFTYTVVDDRGNAAVGRVNSTSEGSTTCPGRRRTAPPAPRTARSASTCWRTTPASVTGSAR